MTACEQLEQVYREAATVGATVGVTSNTVPWELLEAAGHRPVMLRPKQGDGAMAARYMEDVFEPRIRNIFDVMTSGRLNDLKLVVISRASEQEHKLFLYLKELERQDLAAMPEVVLYNLLHSRTDEAYAYGLERTRELAAKLGVEQAALRVAIEQGNRARRALRAILDLRASGRLTGCAALPLIGAHYFLPREEFARFAELALREMEESARAGAARTAGCAVPSGSSAEATDGSGFRKEPRSLLRGLPSTAQQLPKVLIKGAGNCGLELHHAIETHGAVVVAEDDWWGSRALTDDVSLDGDLVRNVFDCYYRSAVSPRAADDSWFEQHLGLVDAVVFYLPPEDDLAGWDYPRWRRSAEQRGLPHFTVHSAEEAARLEFR